MSRLADIRKQDEEEKKPNKKVVRRAFAVTMVVALMLFLGMLLFYFLAHPVIVLGSSMEPTYHSGEILTTTKDFSPEDLKYGSVVAFKDGFFRKLIKRIVAVPGETVEVKEAGVYINGVKKDDSFGRTTVTGGPVTLKENEYYVLGDNRNNSSDSREFGPVSYESITNLIKEGQ